MHVTCGEHVGTGGHNHLLRIFAGPPNPENCSPIGQNSSPITFTTSIASPTSKALLTLPNFDVCGNVTSCFSPLAPNTSSGLDIMPSHLLEHGTTHSQPLDQLALDHKPHPNEFDSSTHRHLSLKSHHKELAYSTPPHPFPISLVLTSSLEIDHNSGVYHLMAVDNVVDALS